MIKFILFIFFVFNLNILKAGDRYEISVIHKENSFGKIIIETFPEVAPKHCKNFDSLVSVKFYDSLAFHRVIPGFMIQGGCPNSKKMPKEIWGEGDPTQTNVPAEFNNVSHERGIVSTARADDPNSGNSQFFICLNDVKRLDGKYTVFARVVTGMNVVDRIADVDKELNSSGEIASPKSKVIMTIKKIKN